MLKKFRNPTTLYCFSPLVMLITCVVELVLAVWAMLRYPRSTVRTLIVSLLVLLATFQMAEYYVCGGLSFSGLAWSRIGYVAITLLPVLGIHLVIEIAGSKKRLFAYMLDTVAFMLVAFFVFSPVAVNLDVCAGNYVVFKLHGLNAVWYGVYYYGTVLFSLMLASRFIEASKKANVRRALQWYVIGALAFLAPTATVNMLNPETLAGIPSIMCGFAVIFALVIALRVLPLVSRKS